MQIDSITSRTAHVPAGTIGSNPQREHSRSEGHYNSTRCYVNEGDKLFHLISDNTRRSTSLDYCHQGSMKGSLGGNPILKR